MAVAYDVRWNVVHAVIIGLHRLSEVRALLDAALADSQVTLPTTVLIDAGEARFSESLEEACLSVDRIASRHSLADSQCAIVIKEPLRRLLSWTLPLCARRHGIDLRLFAEIQQARAWLANPAALPLRPADAPWATSDPAGQQAGQQGRTATASHG